MLLLALAGAAFGDGARAQTYDDGMRAYDTGDFAKALEVWGPLAENGDAVAQYSLGKLLENGGVGVPRDLAEAAKWYQRSANQGVSAAQNNLGLMYGEMGEWKKAVEWYEKALLIGAKTGFVEPHLRLAHIWSQKDRDDPARAERHFAKFFEKFPDDWEGHFERGEHYRRFKQYRKAIADFLRCLEIDKEAHLPMKSLSECYRLDGNAAKATAWLEKFRVRDEEKNRKTAPPQPEKEKPEIEKPGDGKPGADAEEGKGEAGAGE